MIPTQRKAMEDARNALQRAAYTTIHPEILGLCEQADDALRAALNQPDECIAALEAEVERLRARDAEWERKASAWMASPQAVQWLDGYRELAQKLNSAEAEADRLRTLAVRWLRKWQTDMDPTPEMLDDTHALIDAARSNA
jgi:hypothetical protein